VSDQQHGGPALLNLCPYYVSFIPVDLAARADLRNDDHEVNDAKKDSKATDSSRPLLLSSLQRFRALQVEGISLQNFELPVEPIAGWRVASFQIFCSRSRN
jgi:hypothetical protein